MTKPTPAHAAHALSSCSTTRLPAAHRLPVSRLRAHAEGVDENPDKLMQGIPPTHPVTAQNSYLQPYSNYGIRHMRALYGSFRVARAPTSSVIPQAPQAMPEFTFAPSRNDPAHRETLKTWMEASDATGVLVLHDGHKVWEHYRCGMDVATSHNVASLTRSVVGAVTALAVDTGRLDLHTPIHHYLPQLQSSGFAGATVRQLLDMRSGVNSSMLTSMRAMRWIPGADDAPDGIYAQTLSYPASVPHGGPFQYRCADTDLLGLLCSHVFAENFADLTSRLLWQPLGASDDADFVVDQKLTPMFSGGLCMTLPDAGRLGQMFLQRGRFNGRQIIPAWYVDDTRRGDDACRAAFQGVMIDMPLPGAMYRNQAWNLNAERGTTLFFGARGAHIFVDPPSRVVCVVMSQWATSFERAYVSGWMAAFSAITEQLAPHAPLHLQTN